MPARATASRGEHRSRAADRLIGGVAVGDERPRERRARACAIAPPQGALAGGRSEG